MKTLACYLIFPLILVGQLLSAQPAYTMADTALAKKLLAQARDLGNQRKYEDAIEKAEEAFQIYSKTKGEQCEEVAEVYYILGLAYSYTGDYEKAIDNTHKSLELRVQFQGENTQVVANTINNLGVMYSLIGDDEKALEYKKKTLEIREKILGKNHNETASALNNIGNTYNSMGKFKEALEYQMKALEIRKKSTPKTPLSVANSYNSIASTYDDMENFHKALEYRKMALDIREDLIKENHPDLANSYNGIANAYKKVDQYDPALQYYKKGLNMYKEIYGQKHVNVAMVNNNLGEFYRKIEDYQSALSYLYEALSVFEQVLSPSHPYYIQVLHNISMVHQSRRDYSKAIQSQLEVLELRLKKFEVPHPDLSMSFDVLGTSYNFYGDYDQAILYHLKALQIDRKIFGDTSNRVANCYHNLGLSYYLKKDYNIALNYYFQSLEIRKNNERQLRNIGITYNNIAAIYQALGNTDKALEYHEKALKIRKENLEILELDLGQSYMNIGLIYSNKKEYEKALEYFEIVQNIQLSKLSENSSHLGVTYLNKGNLYRSMEKLDSAIIYYQKALKACNYDSENLQSIQGTEVVIKSLAFIGLSKKELFDKKGGLELLKQSLEIVEEGLDVIEFHRDNLSTVSSKTFWQDQTYFLYELALSLGIKIASKENNKNLHLALFEFSEQSKASLLRSQIQEVKALQFINIPDSTIQQEYNLRLDINYFEKQKSIKMDAGFRETDSLIVNYNSKLFDLRQAYDSLKTNLEHNYTSYYQLKYDLSLVGVSIIQKELLQPNQTLLEYFVGDSAIFVFTVNRDDYQVQQLERDSSLEKWITQLRRGLTAPYDPKEPADSPYRSRTYSADQYVEAASRLYELLIAPVENELKEHVIIVPDGVLGYLPFQALLTEKPSRSYRYHSHAYFGRKHRISYNYSATLWKTMREKQPKQAPTKSLLAVAPYYDGTLYTLDSLYQAELAALDIAGDAFTTRDALAPLPHSGAEAYSASQIWNGDYLQNEDATEARFAALAGDYRMLHLATHGEANDKVGEYAYLAFTEIPDSIENELLYIKDIYNLQLNADLVILSACRTATGELQRGEGIISLARAFAYAGAKSIVTTLWKVDDERSKDLMLRFHRHLKAGDDKDTALWKAQNEYLENHTGEAANPFFWAPFIGIGDMGAVE